MMLLQSSLGINTTDTADSELVVGDLFEWLKEEFKFREPTTSVLRIYQSDLVVRFDNSPESLLGGLSRFVSFVQQEMTPPNAHSKKPIEFHLMGLGADPIAPGPSPEISIARRVGVPWRIGLYFSKAHMRTSAHIKALELLDELLGEKG